MEKNIEKIHTYIKSLKGQKNIIGIDGYSGVGKTTIIKELIKEDKSIFFINSDDYTTAINPEIFIIKNNLKNPGKIIEQYIAIQQIQKVKEDIQKIKKGVILVEARFILHKEFKILFDKIIYFSSDFDEADNMREKREKERWGERYNKDLSNLFSNYFRKGYEYYVSIYSPKDSADLVIEKGLLTHNEKTLKKRWDMQTEHAIKNGRSYSSSKKLFKNFK